MEKAIKMIDLRCSFDLMTNSRQRLFADELIDFNNITFNGEERLGKKGHYLKLVDVFDIEPKKSHYDSDYIPNYLCCIVSLFEYEKERKINLYAVYSTKQHKFIIPFNYGAVEIQKSCIVAYSNNGTTFFSHTGEVIMPATKNIRVKLLTNSDSSNLSYNNYFKVTKLRDDWLESCIKSGICKYDLPTLFEEWKAMYSYEIHSDELSGVYSVFEKRLVVPCKYSECYGKSPKQKMDKAYLKVYDGIYTYALYSPDGKCIIPDGKYDDIYVGGEKILARKTFKIDGSNAGIETTEELGVNCGEVEICKYFYEALYICDSLVDIFSLEGKIIEENVWIRYKTSNIKHATALSAAYFKNFNN